MKKILAIAIILSFSFSFKAQNKHTLTIKINNFKKFEGQIGLGLYNTKNQFTDNPWKSYTKSKSEIKDGTLTIVISDIPTGKYVISFLDDLNSNNKMDYAFLGYPKEGFGFSNNAEPGFMSPPTYEECLFEIKENKQINLKVQYWYN